MIQKEIEFEDFNGEMQTETCYFHLSKSELIDMELETTGGMEDQLKNLLKSENGAEMVKLFRKFILMSYGAKSPDGRRFDKTPELTEAFESSPAFDALFVEMMTDPGAAVNFINGMVPKSLSDTPEVQAAVVKATKTIQGVPLPDPNKLDKRGAWPGSTDEDEADERLQQDITTGLDHPRDGTGEYLPWAFREPTQIEMTQMSRTRLHDAFKRKNSGWVPRDK